MKETYIQLLLQPRLLIRRCGQYRPLWSNCMSRSAGVVGPVGTAKRRTAGGRSSRSGDGGSFPRSQCSLGGRKCTSMLSIRRLPGRPLTVHLGVHLRQGALELMIMMPLERS
jgi:hypothetical protein